MTPTRNGLIFIAVATTVIITPGCGRPSTQELMMRAALRQRDSGDDEEEKTTPPPPLKVEVVQATPPAVTPTMIPDSKAAAPPITEDLGITAIDERPATKIPTASGFPRVAEAMTKHAEKHGFPAAYRKTSTGIPTLSWRVQILPELGYEALYKRFDFAKPWNMEPNKSLLKFIPPEYASLGDTRTTLLVPVGKGCMFENAVGRSANQIEDGPENTIMLVEVRDELAVQWTQPKDWIPSDPNDLGSDLGGDSGAFAAWANGWPLSLSKDLPTQKIRNALSYEAGDGQFAGEIHKEYSASPSTGDSKSVAAKQSAQSITTRSQTAFAAVSSPSQTHQLITRKHSVPSTDEVSTAQGRLRKIFSKKISDANSDQEKEELSRELLTLADTMEGKPVDKYVLHKAAIKMSTDACDVTGMINGLDHQCRSFELDVYDETVRTLMDFSHHNADRRADEVDGMEFLKRVAPTVMTGIKSNDFKTASTLARIAYRYLDRETDQNLPTQVNRLHILLASANRDYAKAAENLANYRNDESKIDEAALFGRFLCFIKGDWDRGLPLLAMGGNKSLKRIANIDIAGAKHWEDDVTIGDEWWQLSLATSNGLYKQACRDRAVHWYEQAVTVMPASLDQIHVKNRLDENKHATPSSPIALLKQIADEISIDLDLPLGSIAPGTRSQKRAGNSIRYEGNDDD